MQAPVRQCLARPMRLKELLALGGSLQYPSFFSQREAALDMNEQTQTHPAGSNKIRSEIKSKKESRHLSHSPKHLIVKAAVIALGKV